MRMDFCPAAEMNLLKLLYISKNWSSSALLPIPSLSRVLTLLVSPAGTRAMRAAGLMKHPFALDDTHHGLESMREGHQWLLEI